MVNTVYDGTNSAPRIKKPSVEVFKNLKTKLEGGNPVGFEDFLKIGFAVELKVDGNGEESKEGEAPLPYDDAKLQKVLKLV